MTTNNICTSRNNSWHLMPAIKGIGYLQELEFFLENRWSDVSQTSHGQPQFTRSINLAQGCAA